MSEIRWTDAFLDEMRLLGDPLADAAVRSIFEEGDVQAVNELMVTLVRNDDPPSELLPPIIQDYFNQTDDLPDWADKSKILLGELIFSRYGQLIILILHCSSLPHTYAVSTIAMVLISTARLDTDTHRRISETAQLIIDVMQAGGLQPKGRGIRSVQKVRLMHAAVRQLIQARGLWDPNWGTPINHEDLAITLQTFSFVVLDGLNRLGVSLSRDEEEAYLHAWNVVGHVMGIRPELMPHDMATAEVLLETIKRRQFANTPEGEELTRALIEWMEYLVPGSLFDGFPTYMMHLLMGDETANLLGIPPVDWTDALIRPLQIMSIITDAKGDLQPELAYLTGLFSHQLLRSMLWIDRGGQRAQFNIPVELLQVAAMSERDAQQLWIHVRDLNAVNINVDVGVLHPTPIKVPGVS